MELIDKDKVIEWLEAKKKREGWCAVGADVADVYYARGVRFTCDTCKDFLDTIETKEVDLEKENLTWKDIRELYIIFAEIDAEIEFCKTDIQGETIGYYQEVLKRYKARKGE